MGFRLGHLAQNGRQRFLLQSPRDAFQELTRSRTGRMGFGSALSRGRRDAIGWRRRHGRLRRHRDFARRSRWLLNTGWGRSRGGECAIRRGSGRGRFALYQGCEIRNKVFKRAQPRDLGQLDQAHFQLEANLSRVLEIGFGLQEGIEQAQQILA